MRETGYLPPTEASTSLGGWNNPTYIFIDDNNYTTSMQEGATHSYSLLYGIIPPNATINGITVRIKGKSTFNPNPTPVPDVGAATLGVAVTRTYLGSGVWSADKTVEIATDEAEQLYDFGSSSDLWGISGWTPTDFTNGNFAIRIKFVDGSWAHFNPGLNQLLVNVSYT